MGGGSGDVALEDMTDNPAYEATGEAVSSIAEGDKEKEGQTCEVLSFEASEKDQSLRGTTYDSQEGTADDVYEYASPCVVLEDMAGNPTYETAGEALSSITEGGKEKEGCTYEVLPLEASEEDQGNTAYDSQEGTVDD